MTVVDIFIVSLSVLSLFFSAYALSISTEILNKLKEK
jgi:hypothetical protein